MWKLFTRQMLRFSYWSKELLLRMKIKKEGMKKIFMT